MDINHTTGDTTMAFQSVSNVRTTVSLAPNSGPNVPVYNADRTQVVGHVHPRTTSVGAAKVAGSVTAQLAKVNGTWAWVAKDATGCTHTPW